jgi:hypothetical protein
MAVWQRIDQTPIPLNIGRIWLADEDGNVRRAISWTWPVLKRREPGKYLQWMIRGLREIEPGASGKSNGNTAFWKVIDQAPIPMNTGRIWLADEAGNVIRAMSWTWPMLKSRQPGKYRRWMARAPRATQPPPEALKELAAKA